MLCYWVLICDDFNSPRHSIIYDSLPDHDVFNADTHFLSKNSFTYVSDYHYTVSWLDHSFANQYLVDVLVEFSILYDAVSPDQLVLYLRLILVWCYWSV